MIGKESMVETKSYIQLLFFEAAYLSLNQSSKVTDLDLNSIFNVFQ